MLMMNGTACSSKRHLGNGKPILCISHINICIEGLLCVHYKYGMISHICYTQTKRDHILFRGRLMRSQIIVNTTRYDTHDYFDFIIVKIQRQPQICSIGWLLVVGCYAPDNNYCCRLMSLFSRIHTIGYLAVRKLSMNNLNKNKHISRWMFTV